MTTTSNTTHPTTKKVTIHKKVTYDAAKELKERLAGWGWADTIYTAVKVDDVHFLEFSKPQIQTRFCWGYDDYGRTEESASAQYAAFSEKKFKEENLRAFDDEYLPYIRYSESEKRIRIAAKYPYHDMVHEYGADIVYILTAYDRHLPGEIQLSEEDSDKLREAVRGCIMNMRARFENRIDSYLKRYGLTKVHKWTYWADV